jgi:NAD(P)-dependent dehydrogenase (short-subunit alcohol dehydrogenase family)
MGRAIAIALAEAGSDVAIGSLMESERANVVSNQKVYLLAHEELEQAKAEIEERGVRAVVRPLDVCSVESVKEFYDNVIQTFGKIDILVNAAGTFGVHSIVGHPDSLWHRTIDINLNGPYSTTRICLPGMIQREWGRIINIASTGASVGAETTTPPIAPRSQACWGLLGA